MKGQRSMCSVPDCKRGTHARGICKKHYYHWMISQRERRPVMTTSEKARYAAVQRWAKEAQPQAWAAGRPLVAVKDAPRCPRCSLRMWGEHVCVGPAWAYARSGEAIGG